MQDPIQISHHEVAAEHSFGAYNHSGITQVKHPVTGLMVNMALMPQSPVSAKAKAAMRSRSKQLKKTLRTTAHQQWSIDRRATLTEVGYAKLVGFTMSHIYAQPATGRAQQI